MVTDIKGTKKPDLEFGGYMIETFKSSNCEQKYLECNSYYLGRTLNR